MENEFLAQDQATSNEEAVHLPVPSTAVSIPPPPPFSQFRFKTIGQEPQLLKRISTPIANFQHYEPSSPSPSVFLDPQQPPLPASAFSRPSLLQSLTKATPSTDIMTPDIGDKTLENLSIQSYHPAGAQNTCRTGQLQAPDIAHLLPQQILPQNPGHPVSSQPMPNTLLQAAITLSSSSSALKESIPSAEIAPDAQNISRRSAHSGESSYVNLRALHTRLILSLSNLHPPNTTEALFLIQAANSQSTTALSAAHRSYALSQRSLASAREADTAAQECLAAAEKAKTHTIEAVSAMERLTSNTSDDGGDLGWKANLVQLQGDLQALGKWLGEREEEEALKRPEAAQFPQQSQLRGLTEAKTREVALPEDTLNNQPSLPPQTTIDIPSRHQQYRRYVEHEADAAMQTWCSEDGHVPNALVTTPMNALQTQHEPQIDEISPATIESSNTRSETSLQEGRPRLQAQYEGEMRKRELHEKKLEVARFQMMERERIEAQDHTKRLSDESRLKLKRDAVSCTNGITNEPPRPRAKSAAVEEAKRALEAHNREKERASVEQEQLEQAKRVETRRLLEQRKQRELAELKEKEAERAAELEREAETKEQELIAEQQRRRQEVMALKQRTTAQTAARINAERAREKEKISTAPSSSTSPVPTTSTRHSHSQPSFSGGVKLGLTPTKQSHHSTPPPSPTLVRSAATGLRAVKVKNNTSPQKPQAMPSDRPLRKPLSKISPTTTSPELRHHTPTFPEEVESFSAHSENPGNMYIIPPSQMPPASPEAQAANLRFVKSTIGVLWDTYLTPNIIKREPPPDDHPPTPNNVMVSQTDTVSHLIPKGRGAEPEPPNIHVPKNSLPPKPYPLPPRPKLAHHQKKDSVSSNQLPISPSTHNLIHPPMKAPSPLPAEVHSTSLAKKAYVKRPPPITSTLASSDASGSNKPLSSRTDRQSQSVHVRPSISSRTQVKKPTPVGASQKKDHRVDNARISDPKTFDDQSQIAPIIHANGGWDRPVTWMDDEGNGSMSRTEELTPPYPYRRGEHYSPAPQSPIPSYYPSSSLEWSPRARQSKTATPPPVPRSPILGKRRSREDTHEDGPPPRRQWQPNSDRELDTVYMKRPARLPPSREWSPSLERPAALQARIGHRDSEGYRGGQRYRPAYASDSYKRSPSRSSDPHQPSGNPSYSDQVYTSQDERLNLGRRQVTSSRDDVPSSRGRGNYASRGNRGRGGRGGSRTLNLEERIQKEPLLQRLQLKSPAPKY
ncbi:hypothetical protein H0H81_000738 [Sphagnurus paluster]|uniref:Uncharacterized protein n=1 Tax=Sphagnurus paluster TaxID=117069 RepID=A0A9P7FZX7_9AGAR|nr:hypothetical protein H0H81_000738 [Sphagnurus paluster]